MRAAGSGRKLPFNLRSAGASERPVLVTGAFDLAECPPSTRKLPLG